MHRILRLEGLEVSLILFDGYSSLNCIVGVVLQIISIQCRPVTQFSQVSLIFKSLQIQQTINPISLVYMKTKTNKILDISDDSYARDETENINLINIVESSLNIFSVMQIF